ncbi:hypothetical protein PR048_012191 [Dryococelus australis]|uniref:Uncharacterized protein n=1 Tax=Dryococelus australis TaxID=614101 RepID=A0ABQ9HP93_9NEOP|nr:hypothetical protein PR048_012191 [Dryococelus australis]
MSVIEVKMEWRRNEGVGKREIPGKTSRPTASSVTIPTCENPVTRPGTDCMNGQTANTHESGYELKGYEIQLVLKFLPVGIASSENNARSCHRWRLNQIDFKRVYTEVTLAIGSEFIRHALDDSTPIANLQGNKKRIPYCKMWGNTGAGNSQLTNICGSTIQMIVESRGQAEKHKNCKGYTLARVGIVRHRRYAQSTELALCVLVLMRALMARATFQHIARTLYSYVRKKNVDFKLPVMQFECQVGGPLKGMLKSIVAIHMFAKYTCPCPFVTARMSESGDALTSSNEKFNRRGFARLYSLVYKYADINCTLAVRCHIGRRQLETVLQEVSNTTCTNGVCLLAYHQGEPRSIPGRVTPGFSHVGIVPDDTAGRRVFSGISLSPAVPYSLQSPSSALKTSLLRAAHIYSLTNSNVRYVLKALSISRLEIRYVCGKASSYTNIRRVIALRKAGFPLMWAYPFTNWLSWHPLQDSELA